MPTTLTFTKDEFLVRAIAYEVFEDLPQAIPDLEDRALIEPLLRRSAFLISYQAAYAQMYLVVVHLQGKTYGKPIGHKPAWLYCLEGMTDHPAYSKFNNVVDTVLIHRAEAVYETSSFDLTFPEIKAVIEDLDEVVDEILKFYK